MVKKKTLLIFLGAVVLLAALYLAKGQFIVALVNNRPIWRWTFVKTLEKQGGEQVLDSLIVESLIFQEAKKQKVTISEADINQAIDELKANFTSQGQNFDELLASQGISQQEIRRNIEIQKIAEAIAAKDISVSDEEVANYLTENKDSFSDEENQDELKAAVRKQLEQQKLSQAISQWLDSLRNSAKIKSFL